MLAKAEALKDEIIRLRRDIHAHPELSFQEFRTAQLVADTLAEIGYKEIKTEVGRTGVIAEIGTDDGPVIGIRADMDALPIPEAVDVPFKSTNAGVMHACGHDSHTAMLLGAAHLLYQDFAQNKDSWKGKIRLLFQPSEEAFDEQGISGATAMITDGALDGIDNVIALHIISNLEAGKVYFCDGHSMAAVDSFEAWVRGDGGHGAYPHEGSDPLFMLSSILPQIYGIPSRRISPLEQCVVSLGQISGGAAPNVIPGEVYIQGTIRSFKEEVREKIWAELEQAFKAAESMGGSYTLKIHKGYPAVWNNDEVNNWMRQVAADLAGEEAIVNQPFGMGAEDFAYMTQAAPGAMFMLGGSNGGGNHHTAVFDIEEDVFPLGSAMLAETARRYVTGQLK
ncbi:MAG: amidohydrolase [Anaerolineales bacterium]|nr:amidohydrolase [Anaerolineales bacterium]